MIFHVINNLVAALLVLLLFQWYDDYGCREIKIKSIFKDFIPAYLLCEIMVGVFYILIYFIIYICNYNYN